MSIHPVILLILGFTALIKGGDWLVDGSVSIAKKFSIPSLVIGLTIVSFGTSTPELFVSVFASLNGSPDLAIGNVLGSNTANILLILGIAACIYPLRIRQNTIWKETPFSILAILLVAFLASDTILDRAQIDILNRVDGIILLMFFAVFLYYIFTISKHKHEEECTDYAEMGTGKSALIILAGLAGLTLGGRWIVDAGISIASLFGLSEAVIGLTIVAIGTSLPELAASAVAAYKRHADIAVGNVIGSNIFNTLWILGLSSTIKPLPIEKSMQFDIAIVIGATLLFLSFIYIGEKKVITRWQGASFVGFYIAYIVFRF